MTREQRILLGGVIMTIVAFLIGFGWQYTRARALDSDLQGSGTDLDDLEVKDKRNLVVGTGFTVGPGLYYQGDMGVRTEVSAYLGRDGLEITTPVQDRIEPLIGP